MLTDLLQGLGVLLIVVGVMVWCVPAGLVLLGVALLLAGLALSDGKGLQWRS